MRCGKFARNISAPMPYQSVSVSPVEDKGTRSRMKKVLLVEFPFLGQSIV